MCVACMEAKPLLAPCLPCGHLVYCKDDATQPHRTPNSHPALARVGQECLEVRSICGQCEKPILNGKAVTEAAARNMCIVLFLSHHFTRHVQQHGSIQPSS